MKSFLLVITLLICLNSCDKEVYFNIPENEKPNLKNNDTICFTDTNQNTDTFLVKLSDKYEVSDKRYFHEVILIQYKNINPSGLIREFYVEHRSSTSIYVDSYYFPTIYKNNPLINLDIRGGNYSSVYKNESLNFPDSIPKIIYYSHKHGIIRYDFSNRNYYEISEL